MRRDFESGGGVELHGGRGAAIDGCGDSDGILVLTYLTNGWEAGSNKKRLGRQLAVSHSLSLPNLRAYSSFESAHGSHGLAFVKNIVRTQRLGILYLCVYGT